MIIFTPTLVISCVIIFVLLHLFINTIDDSKKWLNTILALLITPIMYFYIWYPISTIFLPYHHNKHFDSETWIEKPGLRYEMIDNMINILTRDLETNNNRHGENSLIFHIDLADNIVD